MREILFRGKSYGGHWEHGIPVFAGMNKELAYITQLFEHNRQVIPETIGQYTGLTDKNGKKIFEGDVVKAVIIRDLGGGTESREETGIIGYDKIGMIGLIEKYAGTIPVWSDFFQELTLSGCINDFWFEVIGNIHDNPEMLEGNV